MRIRYVGGIRKVNYLRLSHCIILFVQEMACLFLVKAFGRLRLH
jgi:hypothetical protein